jgi:hypothetical protein
MSTKASEGMIKSHRHSPNTERWSFGVHSKFTIAANRTKKTTAIRLESHKSINLTPFLMRTRLAHYRASIHFHELWCV